MILENINPHDHFFRQVFGEKEIAGEFLRLYLSPSMAVLLDTETVELVNTSFIDEDLKEHLSDLLYRVKLRHQEGDVLIYILLEHKSRPDKWVSLQLLRYLTQIWENARRENATELPLVFSVVFYHGKSPWRISRKFSALFEENPNLEFLPQFIPSFDYHLFDLSKYDDNRLQGKPALVAALRLLRDIFRQELKDNLPQTFSVLENEEKMIERAAVMVRYLLLSQKVNEKEIVESLKKASVKNAGEVMKTAIDKYIKQGREIGLQEGISQGISLGKAKLVLGILERKFGALDIDLKNRIEGLAENKIEELGFACLSFQTKNDVANWLKTNK
jgi:predicted transposase/invertase (TIGR01784 family)